MSDLFRLPPPVTPLADEPSPVLDVEMSVVIADTQISLLIAIRCGCEHIHAIEVPLRAGVLLGLKGLERVIEALALPIRLPLAPVTCVAGNAEGELVMTDVLSSRSAYPPCFPGVRMSVSRKVLSFGLSDPFSGRASGATALRHTGLRRPRTGGVKPG